MKDLIKRIKPKNILQVSDILALYRPDAMDGLEHYVTRLNGEESIEYLHEDMKPILQETFGNLVYQEQMLNIVRKFGGRSYGQADLFRKAVGKKDRELVKKESDKLYQEIIDNGYDEETARKISDNMREKGGLTIY